jgi:DNA-binding transcriptional MerR regulator
MSAYSIKDLEHLSGIKAHTLRIWEQRYDIVQPKRTDGNVRYYDDADLKQILNIALLNEHGYKISKIAEMSESELRQEVLSITEKSTKSSEQIQALTLAMIDLDEERFEKIIATNLLQIGFERTMIQIIYPFLVKIGVLWQTGAIHPAQEHFMSHLIRLKLMVAIDGQVVKPKPNAATFLMYLPENEMHELSLLFACYLAKARHHKVIYLGQNTPLQDVAEVYQLHQPDFIFTVVTSMPGQDKIQSYIQQLGQRFPQATLLLTGYQVVGQDLAIPPNALIINKIDDLIGFLEERNNL